MCCGGWRTDGSTGCGRTSPRTLFPRQRWFQWCRHQVSPKRYIFDLVIKLYIIFWITAIERKHITIISKNPNIGNCVSVLNPRSDVCPMKINPPEIMVKRAGATARYINVMIALDCFVKLPWDQEFWRNLGVPKVSPVLTRKNLSNTEATLLMFSYMDGGVLVCGGRSGTEVHQDCVRYIPLSCVSCCC